MDQVQEIRDRIDLATYLSEFITVQKAGRNFKALCPFHGEKTPSLMISPERQVWHCFGCGKGGDIYSFLMEYEHIEFPEALKILAKRAGVTLIQSKYETESSSKKEKIATVNALAAEFYHFVLTKHRVGKRALTYILDRGISEKTIETFKIGFAPSTGNGLRNFLVTKKKFDPQLLFDAGLIGMRGNDSYDFFRGRIMFPLVDHRETIVGFSGRVLIDGVQQAKYVNTKETLLYHKGDMFFGFHMAKEAIRKSNQALIMEGEFDVLSSFQEGIRNSIAVKGTALTVNQAMLLSRYCNKVTMCFDGDKAGKEAIKRSVSVLEQRGLSTTVVPIPGNMDPDEAIRKDPYAFKKAIKEDISVYDFLLDYAVSQFGVQSAEGKRQIANELLPFYTSISNEIVKEHYLKKLSHTLDTTYESILKQAERQQEKSSTRIQSIQPNQKKSREEVLEEYLLALLLQSADQKYAYTQVKPLLTGILGNERAYQKLYHQVEDYFEQQTVFDAGSLSAFISEELEPALQMSSLQPLPHFPNTDAQENELIRVAKELRVVSLRSHMKQLGDEIKSFEEQGKNDEASVLREQLTRTMQLLRTNQK